MEAKEKAIDLINSFKPFCGGYVGESVNRQFAKQSAKLAVIEMIDIIYGLPNNEKKYNYLQEVIQEIEKL